MSTDEKALVKVQDSLIAEIAQFSAQSVALKKKAEDQQVTNELQLASAVAVKKQITAHRKLVQDTRLNYTRQFDEVKKAVMAKEDEIVLPLDEGQTVLGEKILSYQEEQERIRREEAERVEKMVARVSVPDVYRFKTPDDVQDEGERMKKVYTELKPDDQKNPEVKAAFTVGINRLSDRKAYLIEQIEQEEERKRLAAAAERQSEEQAEIDRQKAANDAKARKIQDDKDRLEREKQRRADQDAADEAKKKREADERNRVKSGARTVLKFEVTESHLVPREFCAPDDKLIREGLKSGVEIAGVKTWTEKKV